MPSYFLIFLSSIKNIRFRGRVVTVTLLIIGGGKMGMSHLALCTPYVGKDNIALCESKFLTRLFFRYLGYNTFASVVQAEQSLQTIRGILIATPTPTHSALGQWAIERNIPVFIEKPLTLDVGASSALKEAAFTRGVPNQVGFVMRYVASFQRLRTLVSDGTLGSVKSYSASMRGNVMTAQPPKGNWQGNYSLGGGCLNEYGPHLIDLCLFIFGPVKNVENASAVAVHSPCADDRTSVSWLHDRAGAKGNAPSVSGKLLIDWSDHSKRKSVIEFVVEFEHARLRVDNSAVQIEWSENTPSEKRESVELEAEPANVGYYLRGEEFSLQIEKFLQACGFGLSLKCDIENSNAAADFADGCAVDHLIDLIARKAGLK